jgi:hypothetical protein
MAVPERSGRMRRARVLEEWRRGMEVQFDSRHLKSPAGIAILVVVAIAALGFLQWRRTRLVEEGSTRVAEYLRQELPARYSREMLAAGKGQQIDPARLEALGQVEVLSISPGWLFRSDRDGRVRVRTVVQIGTGQQATFHFQFRSTTTGWRLVRETAPPLLDSFL